MIQSSECSQCNCRYNIRKNMKTSKNIGSVVIIRYMLKIVFTIVCLIGLIFQSTQLIGLHLSGKTIVNIEVRRSRSESIPALTLCASQGISMERVAKFDPDSYLDLFKNYTEAIEMVSRYPRDLNKTELDKQHRTIQTIYTKINLNPGIYYLPVYQILSNLTIPYFEQSVPVVYIKVMGILENSTEYIRFKFDSVDTQPIESIVADMSGSLRKCFTFFSALSTKWRNFRINLDKVDIAIRHLNGWSPANKFYHFYFSIHSPNSLPDFSSAGHFIKLLANKEYSINYWQINTQLLGTGYDTNCNEYDLDNKFANYNMRSDCISSCYLDRIKMICNTTNIPGSILILRKQLLEHRKHETLFLELDQHSYDDVSILAFCVDEDKQFEYQLECSRLCRYDCKSSYYFWDTKLIKEWSRQEHWIKMVRVHLEHNRMPDVLVRHLPETTFISFVCSFGGLLGMWLGLSFFLIFDYTIDFFSQYVFRREHQKVVKNHIINRFQSISKKTRY